MFQSNSTIMCNEIFSDGRRPVYKLDMALQDSSMKVKCTAREPQALNSGCMSAPYVTLL
jgi:hypothetical protein